MPWLDDLNRLRVRVDNEGYGRQMSEVAERRGLLEKYADGLGVEKLLTQMNDVLLDGGARLIVDRSWQYDFEGDDDSDFEGLNDQILYTLYWHDGDPVELEVLVGIDDDDAGYVMVDDEEIDDDADSIQEALLDAFRDIAEITK
ncbi:MAG: hypothetical protein F4W95_12525 [Chloroflexi bacterium]|nr:hypothetical protein [Chloroflexota bacterium]MYD49292.1 hypothetical protein [Chloroflexota bacterium]